jgi:hypothetical protein
VTTTDPKPDEEEETKAVRTQRSKDTTTTGGKNEKSNKKEEENKQSEVEVETVSEAEDQEETRAIGDLPGANLTDADRMMDKVYGDHVHQNPGKHLDGGIADDPIWQEHWRRLVVYSTKTYDVPRGALGRKFVSKLNALLGGFKQGSGTRRS